MNYHYFFFKLYSIFSLCLPNDSKKTSNSKIPIIIYLFICPIPNLYPSNFILSNFSRIAIPHRGRGARTRFETRSTFLRPHFPPCDTNDATQHTRQEEGIHAKISRGGFLVRTSVLSKRPQDTSKQLNYDHPQGELRP